MSFVVDPTLYLGLIVIAAAIIITMTLKPKSEETNIEPRIGEGNPDKFALMIDAARRRDYLPIFDDIKKKADLGHIELDPEYLEMIDKLRKRPKMMGKRWDSHKSRIDALISRSLKSKNEEGGNG